MMPTGNPVAGPELDTLDLYIRTVLGMTMEYQEPAFTIFRNRDVAP
jgi:hypothetical protein